MHNAYPLRLIAFCLLVLSFSPVVTAEDPKRIQPAGYVTDLAGVIEPEAKSRLTALCLDLEHKTGAQMAIVTVRSLGTDSIENFSVDLYKQFGVGNKTDNRGVLLLVAPNDHRYRIEVSYGLEPIINDARAGDAGRAMAPFLRQGDYSAAIEAAAWRLAKYIADDRGVTLSAEPPPAPPQNRRSKDLPSLGFWGILLIIWIIFSIARSGRRGVNGRRGGGGWWIGPFLGGMSGGGWRGGGRFGGGFGGSSGGGGFGGFGGGSSGGGGASGSW